MNNHLPTTPKELNFHAELKAVSRWRWLGGRLYLAMKESLDSRRKIAAEETLKSWKKLEAEFLLNEIYSPGLSFLCFDVSGYIQALEKYLRMTAEDDLPEVEMATVNEEEQFESANGNSSVTAEDDLPEGEMATLNEEEQFESANVLLVKDPKLYVSLNEEIKQSVRGQKGESLENVCPWKRDIAKLSEYFSQKEKFDGIFQVELKDSTNASCALRIQEIQRCLKFNSLLVQAVIVYVKDHSPTTPEELNFHAELKAARHWCWLDDHKQLVMKRVPVGDCRLKIAATETLKTWKKMEKELQTIKANKMGAVILRFDVLSSSYETSEGPFVSYLLPAEVQDCHTMMDC